MLLFSVSMHFFEAFNFFAVKCVCNIRKMVYQSTPKNLHALLFPTPPPPYRYMYLYRSVEEVCLTRKKLKYSMYAGNIGGFV